MNITHSFYGVYGFKHWTRLNITVDEKMECVISFPMKNNRKRHDGNDFT